MDFLDEILEVSESNRNEDQNNSEFNSNFDLGINFSELPTSVLDDQTVDPNSFFDDLFQDSEFSDVGVIQDQGNSNSILSSKIRYRF